MKPFLVVLPFHRGDFALALSLVDWIKDLGGAHDYPLLLLASKTALNVEALRIKEEASSIFCRVDLERSPGLPDERWPIGANLMFRHACELILGKYKLPFLWMEPDCVPMGSGWLDEIQSEYAKCGRFFMGNIRKQTTNPKLPSTYLPGCSVYPAHALTLLRNYWNPIEVAWDVATAAVSVPLAHKSLLFYEWWGQSNLAPRFKPERSTSDPINVMVPSQIPAEAVFFHRCKDGALIRCLRQKASIPARPAEKVESPSNNPPPCLIMLGGAGDVLIALCIAYHYFTVHRQPVPFITSDQCTGMLEGVSYAQRVSRQGVDWHSYKEAIAWARKRYGRVLPLHAGEPEIIANLKTPNFCHEEYLLAELPGKYDSIPLVFDRRNRAREADLIAKVSDSRPLFLYNFTGKTSPLPSETLVAAMLSRFGKSANFVDTSRLQLPHYHDLLGLLEKSVGMITIDTSNIHMMAASQTPYIALLNDSRIPWCSSVPRGNCVFQVGYTQVHQRTERILAEIGKLIARPAPKVAPQASLITLACDGMEAVWDLARQTWEPYCRRHGYSLECSKSKPRPGLAPSWNKLLLVLSALEKHQVVWWIDSDITVADHTACAALPDSLYDLTFASDWNGLCAGMFRAVNTQWARDFLKAAALLGDVADDDQFGKGLGCKWEQNTIKLLAREFPSAAKHIGFLPPGFLNDQPHKPKGESFCHFGCMTNQQRIAAMKARHNL